MTEKLFETALGVSPPWHVVGVEYDGAARMLTIQTDFTSGSQFAVAGVEGVHPVHDSGDPKAIGGTSIDMSPAFIKGVSRAPAHAQITFDKIHVMAHALTAIDKTRRIEQQSDPSLKGLRWKLLKDRRGLNGEDRAELDALLAQLTTKRTARAWQYREQLREILDRKQINVVRALLQQWCTNVLRSKVEPMKEVAQMIRNHLEGIIA